MGNRVCKKTTEGENVTERKYLVDIAGGLSTIIGEIEADSSSPDYGSLKKSYFYADGQILSQRAFGLTIVDFLLIIEWTPSAGDFIPPPRFAVLAFLQGESFNGMAAEAVNSYTYTPFGQVYDGQCVETVDNPWQFTGQWHDGEIDQYTLRARMYDPTMMRFTSRDPIRGSRENPLTLHKYLYCLNDPGNRIDPSGKLAGNIMAGLNNMAAVHAEAVNLAVYSVSTGDDRFLAMAVQVWSLNFILGMQGYALMNPGGKFELLFPV